MARQPSKQSAQSVTAPAPTRGMDLLSQLSNMPIDSCVYSYNLIPASYGMKLRNGFVTVDDDIPNADTGEPFQGTKSIIVFNGGGIDGSTENDKLFAVSNVGIFDITDPNSPPIEKLTFSSQAEAAGNGVDIQYTDQAGDEYILYADESNGLFTYTAATQTWNKATGIDGGINLDNVVFCVVHKLRLWLVEKNSANAWYLPVHSMQGTAIKFNFGSKFKHGGKIKGLWNWSIDGGEGVDDYLVAISSAGDVLPFKGSDPSDANTWTLVGSFFVGGLPVGRRVVSEAGGSLSILSSYGVISMSELLRGMDVTELPEDSMTGRISPMIREHLSFTSHEYGWEILYAPAEGVYIINSPPLKNSPQIQYIMDISKKSWAIWRGVPMLCLKEWKNSLYFGFEKSVYVMVGYRDDVPKEPSEGNDGYPVEFSLLTSFSDLGSSARNKLVQLIRPDFLSTINPSYNVKAVYDYALGEKAYVPTGGEVGSAAVWDNALWDMSVWGSSDHVGHSRLSGGSNMGRTAAIAIRGSSSELITLISMDVMFTVGGSF